MTARLQSSICHRQFSALPVLIYRLIQGRAFAGKAAAEKEPYVFLFGQRFDSRMLRFVRRSPTANFATSETFTRTDTAES